MVTVALASAMIKLVLLKYKNKVLNFLILGGRKSVENRMYDAM